MVARSSSRTGRAAGLPSAPETLTAAGVPVEVRRSARARRLSLRVSRLDGRARVTAPLRCGADAILSFLDAHGEWLAAAVERTPEPIPLTAGAAVPYRGRLMRLEPTPGRRGVQVDWDGGRLQVGGAAEAVGSKVAVWLRERARERLHDRTQVHCAALGVRFASITIRDTRSRWGSCSSTGALSYSWRLILAPDDVLDYVAAHEVAHLREMNHSGRFWALVETLRPDWRTQRRWLRDHGAELHRYLSPRDAASRAA